MVILGREVALDQACSMSAIHCQPKMSALIAFFNRAALRIGSDLTPLPKYLQQHPKSAKNAVEWQSPAQEPPKPIGSLFLEPTRVLRHLEQLAPMLIEYCAA